MSAAILAMQEVVDEVEPWIWKTVAVVGTVGFSIGVGIMLWVKWTLVMKGIFHSLF